MEAYPDMKCTDCGEPNGVEGPGDFSCWNCAADIHVSTQTTLSGAPIKPQAAEEPVEAPADFEIDLEELQEQMTALDAHVESFDDAITKLDELLVGLKNERDRMVDSFTRLNEAVERLEELGERGNE